MPASLHPYQYAFNSPAQFSDPSGEFPLDLVPFLLWVSGGAVLMGGIEYGGQVYDNYQQDKRGWDMWTSICWGEVGIAALGGGTAAAVSFFAGPWLASVFGLSTRGLIIAGMLEGSLSDVAATAVMRLVTGRPITAESLRGWSHKRCLICAPSSLLGSGDERSSLNDQSEKRMA